MNVVLQRHVSARICIFVVSCCSLAACSRDQAPVAETAPPAPESAPPTIALVDGERIINADAEPGNWLSNGRTYSEQRYSPLDEIDESTVTDLGLAWYLDLDTSRGQQASPIVVDGVMHEYACHEGNYSMPMVLKAARKMDGSGETDETWMPSWFKPR